VVKKRSCALFWGQSAGWGKERGLSKRRCFGLTGEKVTYAGQEKGRPQRELASALETNFRNSEGLGGSGSGKTEGGEQRGREEGEHVRRKGSGYESMLGS